MLIFKILEFKTPYVLVLLLICGFVEGQTYTFTSAGASGRFGPNQTQINNTYTNTNLSGNVITTAGIQSWTVPSSGLYRIEARGAKAGNGQTTTGGAGAIMQGDFTFTVGQVLKILVGQIGGNGHQGGGGGASFVVYNSNIPLVIAGGAGGAANLNSTSFSSVSMLGTTLTAGMNGVNGNASVTAGIGGTSGGGGSVTTAFPSSRGAGGGGLIGNGLNGNPAQGGSSFINGGTGGAGATSTTGIGGDGGFGGGGGGDWTGNTGSGGGGGYSGGGGGVYFGCGGGGGSYNSGSNQLNSTGTNSTTGLVLITKLSGVNIAQTSSIQCNGQLTGALSATAFGGTAPYTYTWLPSGSVTNSINGLGPGIYTCNATDANSVVFSSTFAIAQPSVLTAAILAQNNVSCNGGTNGSVTITTMGGTPAYNYTWFPTGGNMAFAVGLSAGSYTCNIKDQNNCTTSLTTTITQPTPLIVTGFATNSTVCQGGTSMLIGAGALTYLWSDGQINGAVFTPTITKTYTVTGTSAAGCTGTATATINVNPLPVLTISGSNSVCAGNTVVLSANGANSYTWNGSVVSNTIAVSPTSTGTYNVVGTGSNSCQNNTSISISVFGLPAVTASATSFSVCQGNAVVLYGNGASSYSWTSGVLNNISFVPSTTSSYTLTGSNSCGSNTVAITVTVVQLPTITASASNSHVCFGNQTTFNANGANSFTWTGGIVNNVPFTPTLSGSFTVGGSNACGTSSAIVSITVNPLPDITVSATNATVCLGGTTALQAYGASSYSWSGGITNGVPFLPTISKTYSVSASDANGCQNHTFFPVSVITLPSLSVAVSNTSICIGNTVSVNAVGANSYTWSGGISNGNAFTPSNNSTYTVLGSNYCGTSSANVSITVNPLPIIGANIINPSICIGGTVMLQGTGGNSYIWTGGITNNLPFSPPSSSSYTVTGTDVNGCQSFAIKSITVNSLPVVGALASTSFICSGGTVALIGTGALNYSWTGGVSNAVAFSPSITSGYTVTGTDGNGCKSTAVKSISVGSQPSVNANTSSTVVCFGQSITVFGIGAITYTWSNGIINNLPFIPSNTATYTVSGTNACGTNTASIAVTVNALPAVTIAVSSPSVCSGTSVSISASGADTYTWSGGVTNGNPFVPASTATYVVTGTSTNACQNTATQVITVVARPTVTANASSLAICIGASVSLTGTGADTYTWSGGINNSIPFTPTSTSSYFLSGTNTLTGCSSTNTAARTVSVNSLPTVSANLSFTTICLGTSATLIGSGASTYSWSGNITNGVAFQPTVTSTYTLNGTNIVTGCTSTNIAAVTISVNMLPIVSSTLTNPVVCFGNSCIINASGADIYIWSGGITNGQAFIPTVTSTYTVTGTNLLTGCTSTNNASQTVVVNTLPQLSVSSSSSVICSGSTVSILAANADVFLWSHNLINGVPFTPTLTNTYTVVGTNTTTGCAKTQTQTVVVNDLPTLTVNASSSSICIGNTVSLIGSGADTYTWTGGINNGIPFSPSVSTTYTCTGTKTLTGCKNMLTKNVLVNQLPVILVVANPTSVCSGESVSVSAFGADTYTWSNNIINGGTFHPTITTTYSVIGTNTLTGCTNTNQTTQTIFVNPSPTLSIVSSGSIICSGETTTLSALGAINYTWSNGISSSQVIETLFTPVTFSVVGSDNNGCLNEATYAQGVDECTNLRHIEQFDSRISIYPNPSDGVIFIESEKDAILNLYNGLGQKIRLIKLDYSNNWRIKIDNLKSGVYFILERYSKQEQIKKILIYK